MVVAKKYQFRLLVNSSFFSRDGAFAIAITSLNVMICTAVTMAMMYRCPAAIDPKKSAIIASVHIVRVINVCFFFSYSESGASS